MVREAREAPRVALPVRERQVPRLASLAHDGAPDRLAALQARGKTAVARPLARVVQGLEGPGGFRGHGRGPGARRVLARRILSYEA